MPSPCRKFFGTKGAPPKQQTKLSFAPKAAKKEQIEEVTEPVSAKENKDLDQGMDNAVGF
jgi:DNA ligase 1